MPIWAQAGLWGLLASPSLVIEVAIRCFAALPKRLIAGINGLWLRCADLGGCR
jgi:hypothetical protein